MSKARRKNSKKSAAVALIDQPASSDDGVFQDMGAASFDRVARGVSPVATAIFKWDAPSEDVIPDTIPAKAHYEGHRQRLRQRFLASGPDSLQDYELLELLLFSAIPRKDVKPLAKSLLTAFGSLWGVVNAPHPRLRTQFKLGDTTIGLLSVVSATALRMTKQQIARRPILGSWQAVLEYCEAAMAHETIEQFRLLFLDRKNILIADEVQQKGTVDHTPVYPREIVKRALELGATAIILVHNHPSGDPTPSRADIDMTRHVMKAAEAVGIHVHDHIIVGKGRHESLKNLGLMKTL